MRMVVMEGYCSKRQLSDGPSKVDHKLRWTLIDYFNKHYYTTRSASLNIELTAQPIRIQTSQRIGSPTTNDHIKTT